MSKENWNQQHIKYSQTDWINKPTLFAEKAIKFFPPTGKIIDVGCGQGQDSRFFAKQGYEVLGLDFSEEGIRFAKEKNKYANATFRLLDLSEILPFQDEYFDVVYSHLALHYFDKDTTKSIFRELSRILKRGGILAVFVNSIHDPEYNTGQKIEGDYFNVRGTAKRYFSKASIEEYLKGFETQILDEEGETYKDRAINVNNLVEYIGRKI